jgi:hypothetical protein
MDLQASFLWFWIVAAVRFQQSEEEKFTSVDGRLINGVLLSMRWAL